MIQLATIYNLGKMKIYTSSSTVVEQINVRPGLKVYPGAEAMDYKYKTRDNACCFMAVQP